MGVFSRVQPLHLPHGTLLPGQSACLSSAPLQISIPHPAVWGSLCHGLQVYLNGDLETVPRLSGGIPLNGGDPMSPPKLCSPQPEKHVASPESVVVRVPQVCSAASSAAVGSRVLRAILTPRPSSAKEGTAWSFAPNALLSRWEGKPGQPHGIYAWGCPNAPGTLGGRREAPPPPRRGGLTLGLLRLPSSMPGGQRRRTPFQQEVRWGDCCYSSGWWPVWRGWGVNTLLWGEFLGQSGA